MNPFNPFCPYCWPSGNVDEPMGPSYPQEPQNPAADPPKANSSSYQAEPTVDEPLQDSQGSQDLVNPQTNNPACPDVTQDPCELTQANSSPCPQHSVNLFRPGYPYWWPRGNVDVPMGPGYPQWAQNPANLPTPKCPYCVAKVEESNSIYPEIVPDEQNPKYPCVSGVKEAEPITHKEYLQKVQSQILPNSLFENSVLVEIIIGKY